MSGTKRGYSPRRAGEVVGVAVHADEPRPVWVSVHDHAHTYEIAWRDTDAGSVITDLRVHSDSGAPITAATLRRINTDTLLRAARRYDTTEDAALGRELRATFDAAIGDSSVDTSGIASLRFTEGIADAMAKHLPPGAVVPTSPSQGGRPPLAREFLARVADWAREGRERNASIYAYVAERAAAHLGHPVPADTVKGWIQRAKEAEPPLLGRDELRKPRAPQPAAERKDR